MRDGFVKVAAGTPKIRVADCDYNAGQIIALMKEAAAQGVKVLALPELCVTGYTCGDLFLQDTLLDGAERALARILEETKDLDVLTALGVPVRCEYNYKTYNCAVIILRGEILGLVPKTHLPNYREFYEARWFTPGTADTQFIELCGQTVSFGSLQTFSCQSVPGLTVGVEVCEDLWAVDPPSNRLAAHGATLILNLSASDEVVGKAAYRRQLVTGQSGRLCCAYVYADAGEGESSTDLVFAGHNMIAENGALLAEQRFSTGLTISELDVDRLCHERRQMNTFPDRGGEESPWTCAFSLNLCDTVLTRPI
ncbi:MAG: NAD(+) synthase, partial [Oscillospiraceae bacterium]|nr:NAD(+) synthase [Oscillospiraceae bacterium]